MDRITEVRIPVIMTPDNAGRLLALLNDARPQILELWLQEIRTGADKPGEDEAVVSQEIRQLLDALVNQLQQDGLDPDARRWHRVNELLREITTRRARAGGSPRETARQVLALKQALIRTARSHYDGDAATLMEVMLAAQALVDEMSLLALAFYMESRERIIQQQSLSLLELSTPVVKLWQQVLLLPLVGIIDTTRAREITESLLEAVARNEAAVTLIDVTGVPVLDTSVAGHLMKTVAAAQMLGTRVIITGISPQGAQTLVKLGVDLSGVTTRGSLRSGVAEAFNLIGRRIVPTEVS